MCSVWTLLSSVKVFFFIYRMIHAISDDDDDWTYTFTISRDRVCSSAPSDMC